MAKINLFNDYDRYSRRASRVLREISSDFIELRQMGVHPVKTDGFAIIDSSGNRWGKFYDDQGNYVWSIESELESGLVEFAGAIEDLD